MIWLMVVGLHRLVRSIHTSICTIHKNESIIVIWGQDRRVRQSMELRLAAQAEYNSTSVGSLPEIVRFIDRAPIFINCQVSIQESPTEHRG